MYAVGEDRSSYQRIEGWTGNEFGFAKATEGLTHVDSAFAPNWANLRRESLVRGAYHFFHPALDAAEQARFFVSTVQSHGGIIPGDVFIIDAEITSGDDGMELSPAAPSPRMSLPLLQGPVGGPPVGEAVLTCLQAVESLVGSDCPVVLYTDLYMAQNYLTACSEYPLYAAFYEPRPPASVAPWPHWTFWQFEQGGAPGGGDADYFNGDLSALLAWRASYDWTEALVANLPTLQAGSEDQPGGPWHVHRAQALVAGIGRWNDLGSVTQIADDGNFGESTKAAVEVVQRHFGLATDGVVGQGTWEALIG